MSERLLLVRADPSRLHSLKTATDNPTTNLSQHATQQANEFVLLLSHRLIAEFLFQNEITLIGGTLTQEKLSAFYAQPAKAMLYTSFANCIAAGGMPLPTR